MGVLRTWLKNLRTSTFIVLIVSVVSGIYFFVTNGSIVLDQVFIANFAVGTVLATGGILLLFFPPMIKRDKLLDHSTYLQRMGDAREKKRKIAYDMLYVGLGVTAITAVVELVVRLFI